MDKVAFAIKMGKKAAQLNNAHQAAGQKPSLQRAGNLAFNQGASHGKEMGKSYLKTFEVVPRLVLRGVQLIAAIIICGFYGNRINVEQKDHQKIGMVWVYAVTIAGLSGVTAIFFAAAASAGSIPVIGSRLKLLKAYRAYPWDAFLFVAWMSVFGTFAHLFLKRKADDKYRGSNTAAMKIALWIDLTNAVLWFLSALYGWFKAFAARKADRLTDKAGQKIFKTESNAV
ncbi:hypothetical protein ED733_001939 [Metarhizium rileyi]|uniref:MARVEL domain-containing protein n=1 Tax=Metarhizium rileyi (strain RCEF 4871) TaxID=1649241 RepID=A0A5C6G4Y9_METRR|nr:hypothetical protein ED733_001939 [Metarhizium rileyi]